MKNTEHVRVMLRPAYQRASVPRGHVPIITEVVYYCTPGRVKEPPILGARSSYQLQTAVAGGGAKPRRVTR